ncbi:hypothetical protein AgCh_004262 [Apium graveolens]
MFDEPTTDSKSVLCRSRRYSKLSRSRLPETLKDQRLVARSSPADFGCAAPMLEPSSVVVSQTRVNGTGSHMHNQVTEESTNRDVEENDEIREKHLHGKA